MISPIVSVSARGRHLWSEEGRVSPGMNLDERIRNVIQDIAQRRNNVTLSEIEWVIDKLSETYTVRRPEARHGVLFGFGNQRFMVNHHNPGNKQTQSHSCISFVNPILQLGLYV